MTSLERMPGRNLLGIYLIFIGVVAIFHLELVTSLVSIMGAVAGMLLIQEAAPPPGKTAEPDELKNIGKVIPDDLTRIVGITPAVEAALNAAKIKTYFTLGKTKPETLRKILKKAGGGLETIDPSAWQRQARLADKQRWDEMEPAAPESNTSEKQA